jgi:hypothetical protein
MDQDDSRFRPCSPVVSNDNFRAKRRDRVEGYHLPAHWLPHAGADPLAEKLATKPYQISSTSPIGVAMYRFRAAFENWTGPAPQVRLDDRQLRFPGAGG